MYIFVYNAQGLTLIPALMSIIFRSALGHKMVGVKTHRNSFWMSLRPPWWLLSKNSVVLGEHLSERTTVPFCVCFFAF